MANLSPEQISPAFTDHIMYERRHRSPVTQTPLTSAVRDRCVDKYDVNILGMKTGILGTVVAGSGVRRGSHNDIGLSSEYEFLQEAAQYAGDHGIGTIKVEAASHNDCGEIFVHGAVTRDAQKGVRGWSQKRFDEAYKKMQRLAPSDARRVEVKNKVEPHGSAPTVRFRLDGRLVVVNEKYWDDVIYRFPLGLEAIDRLVEDQREELERRQRVAEEKKKWNR